MNAHTQDPSLVILSHGQAVTTTLAIAEGTGNDHASVIKLVRHHQEDYQEFGPIGFEIRKGSPLPHGGFAKPTEYALLNEHQATLLIAFMRNSPVVVEFKKRLVREFFRLARQIREMEQAEAAAPVAAGFGDDTAIPTGTPFDRVQGAKLASLLRISRKTANAYLAVCGVTPDYIETVAPSLPQGHGRGDSLTDALALLGSAGEWYAECLEYGFIVEGSEWPTFPLTTKAVQDAYSAWCRQRGRRDQGLVGLGRFLAGVGIKRRRPLVKQDGYSFQPNAYEFPPIEHARKLAEIKTGARHGR